ncbi:MAG TPA: hypothetical protein VEX43_10500 [Chthoniobacterales bacterium]|nr:hypothetical protein [Chthoniobacterales bacterium]
MKENPLEKQMPSGREATGEGATVGTHHVTGTSERHYPDASDANFRVTCNEIAEQLSKHWRFKLHVGGLVATALFVLAGAMGGIVGWSITATLASERQQFQEEAKHEIGLAKQAVESQIMQELKKENVQKTMELAAGKEAAALLAKSVEPNIKAFQQKLDTSLAELEARFREFNDVIQKNEQKSASNVENLRTELSRLQKRNNLTALADKAISEGDVVSYRRLETLMKTSEGEEKNAATSELIRVYQTYSIFSGISRTSGVELNIPEINPTKTKEEELEIEDLLPLLKELDNPLARVKVAHLLWKKAKRGSFKTAEAIVEALKKETHLEAFKNLGLAFQMATGRGPEGKLDKRELLQWWEENKSRLRKEDTDVSPTPTPSPSAGKS